MKLCQATRTTHSHSRKFDKIFKKLCEFHPTIRVVFAQESGWQFTKLLELIFKVFILCFQVYLFSFCIISLGLRVQVRYLLANLRKIYVHDVNMMHHKLFASLNWTARSQYSCRLSNNRELKQATFLTRRTSTGSKFDVISQSRFLAQSFDVTRAARVVKNVGCLSSLIITQE